jgi:nucleoside-specific outer membrane channel protein Tsx
VREPTITNYNVEDAMKLSAALLSFVLAGGMLTALPAGATQDAAEKKETAKKEAKWQGRVTRVSKEQSTIEIHGGPHPSEAQRTISYDSSTQWTKLGKAGHFEDVVEGSFVIALGNVDDKGVLHATRVDVRLK